MSLREAYIIKSSTNGRRHICIDALNEKAIMDFLREDSTRINKFRQVRDMIVEGIRNSELYGREDIDKNCKNVTAIKLFKGGQNIRIYCKEIHTAHSDFHIIVSELLPKKKDQKVQGKVKSLIKIVASYEYTIVERPKDK